MKYKTGKEEVRVYKRLPAGWVVSEGAWTNPSGTVWASNGEPRFKKGKDGEMRLNPNYKHALVVKNENYMISSIAENRRRHFREDAFITDQATEKKIQAEMRRQAREQKKIEQEREKRYKSVEKRLSAEAAKKSSSKSNVKTNTKSGTNTKKR